MEVVQPSLRDFSSLRTCTQDYVLGYFQTSLRDSSPLYLKTNAP
jgi:hypothetical protein